MGRGPSLVDKEASLDAKTQINKVFRSDLLPLGAKWSHICAGKEMCFTQDECVCHEKPLVAAFF